MAKKNSSSIQPKWIKQLRDYIATLEKQDATREKISELRRSLLESCTEVAADFQRLSPEHRVMLKLALQLKPIPSALHVLEAEMAKARGPSSTPDARNVPNNGRDEAVTKT